MGTNRSRATRRPGTIAAVCGLIVGGVAAAGIAGASIPDSGTGTFHGCIDRNGHVRVIDPSQGQTCRRTETAIQWNQTGQAGQNGSNGAPGTNGTSVLNGTGAPSNALGANGDFYIDTAAHTIYGPKANGQWPASGTNLVGPSGQNGSNGAPGTNGASVLNGTGAPSNALGANGDFYIDTAAHTIYGPKANGQWPASGTNLVGPSGQDGAAGPGATAFTTPGTFSYTVPANVTSAIVELIGGGGAGGFQFVATGGGGGAGAHFRAVVSGLTPGASVTVVVGSGGIGGIPTSPSGNSSFGSVVAAGGGAGGDGTQCFNTPGGGSGGQVTLAGAVGIDGGPGASGQQGFAPGASCNTVGQPASPGGGTPGFAGSGGAGAPGGSAANPTAGSSGSNGAVTIIPLT